MKKPFETIVDEVLEEYKDADVQDINRIVEEICEEYIIEHNKKPDAFQLTRLANLILKDDFRNRDSYKVQKEDYPFHSENQSKRRKKKEFVAQDDTIDFMNYKNKVNLSTAPPKDNRR